jgi:adenosine/AMP kinase
MLYLRLRYVIIHNSNSYHLVKAHYMAALLSNAFHSFVCCMWPINLVNSYWSQAVMMVACVFGHHRRPLMKK